MANKTWAPPGHFYSPLVDPQDPHVQPILRDFYHLELPAESGIDLDRERMLAMLERLGRHYGRIPFGPQKIDGLHYYYENPTYSYGDAIVLATMMMEFRPQRMMEVGSGFSSAAMIDVNERIFDGAVELRFIEPYPEILLNLLPTASRYRNAIIPQPVQSIPLETFRTLEANDILFIDSTHVSKMGSDVNYLIFNVLPILKQGVVIHAHDIFYPFEYLPGWILNENRSWNEAYLLRAFLMFNRSFEILFFNHYAIRKFPEQLLEHMPLFLNNHGGGLWLRRVS